MLVCDGCAERRRGGHVSTVPLTPARRRETCAPSAPVALGRWNMWTGPCLDRVPVRHDRRGADAYVLSSRRRRSPGAGRSFGPGGGSHVPAWRNQWHRETRRPHSSLRSLRSRRSRPLRAQTAPNWVAARDEEEGAGERVVLRDDDLREPPWTGADLFPFRAVNDENVSGARAAALSATISFHAWVRGSFAASGRPVPRARSV